MMFPGETEYLQERAAVLDTMESLTDDEFEHGRTLCEEWAPRDVLAHLLGIDSKLGEYRKAFGSIDKGNAGVVAAYRSLSRDELLDEARAWAENPATLVRPLGWFLLGDVAMHHQDVLRGVGRTRDVPKAARDALLREGSMLGARRLMRYRAVPDDGGRPRGRGQEVKGTSEALALWLAGRKGLADELEFAP